MSSATPTVLVAAAPSLYRQGLLATLRDSWPASVITIIPATQQLPALLSQHAYSLVIVDSYLSDESLLTLLPRIQARRSQPMLVLSDGPCPRPYQPHPGPVAWLDRHTPLPDFIDAVAPWLDAEPAVRLCPCGPPSPFSPRELEVLHLVVADHNNLEIADRLCLSVRTVESHRRALLQKAGAKTLLGLAVLAVKRGWVGV
ncbi:LuxR C-terminal-related transcriptional regulator [Hymenobacter sp. BT175]|uniref:LuxR C-terminal-related transcriptional regulator n=1 Tax=Hymenobacter translucens TaxID=2886507 RepID=UPI001D0DDB27|nr:LuxR C-terminal-related transcriptional regulator [Hymenobacter translucens]MCC2545932.1 LuxR C-terminal-related transcriptional regulator [Hymenobacter translucens]